MGLTTDRNDPALEAGQKNATGQHSVYLVLSDEERAKGFVRPFRDSYVHVGPQANKHPLRDLTPDEAERYRGYNYVKAEDYPESESPLVGRMWTQAQLDAASQGGCKVKTVMGRAISETYARDPRFYGATFCVGCNVHLPVAEFVWDGTSDRVGS
jgi:hypothetical protein